MKRASVLIIVLSLTGCAEDPAEGGGRINDGTGMAGASADGDGMIEFERGGVVRDIRLAADDPLTDQRVGKRLDLLQHLEVPGRLGDARRARRDRRQYTGE